MGFTIIGIPVEMFEKRKTSFDLIVKFLMIDNSGVNIEWYVEGIHCFKCFKKSLQSV